MNATPTSQPILLGGLGLLVALLVIASALIGYTSLDMTAAVSDLLRGRDTLEAMVLTQLRLPRALLGAAIGFSLGLTGAVMQGLMRNPLADPGIVGVSGAAALGAVVAFYSGLANQFALALPLGGLAGAGIATALLLALARNGTGTSLLILAGIALNSLAGALTALALNLSPSPYATLEIVFWLMGSLADRSLDHVLLAAPFMLIGWMMMLRIGPGLDALTLGEDTAASMGISLKRLRLLAIGGAAAAVGASVAVTGAIGFVGLVVPHLLRPLVGHRPGRLLLASGLGGAALTLAADCAVRLAPIRPELKLGVVTALIGAPFFLALLWRLRREAE
ncbi:FecCD family ABC transporter permease [Xanthobacteraceae bacterium A53D]